jgi:hypothetical protein
MQGFIRGYFIEANWTHRKGVAEAMRQLDIKAYDFYNRQQCLAMPLLTVESKKWR